MLGANARCNPLLGICGKFAGCCPATVVSPLLLHRAFRFATPSCGGVTKLWSTGRPQLIRGGFQRRGRNPSFVSVGGRCRRGKSKSPSCRVFWAGRHPFSPRGENRGRKRSPRSGIGASLRLPQLQDIYRRIYRLEIKHSRRFSSGGFPACDKSSTYRKIQRVLCRLVSLSLQKRCKLFFKFL